VDPIKYETEPNISLTPDELLYSDLNASKCQCPTISTPDISIKQTEHVNRTEDYIPINIIVPSPESSEKPKIVDPKKCETEPNAT
jgi:hypothetical protein